MNLNEARILVTATSFGKNDARLKTELEAQVASVTYNLTGKPLTSEQIAELLPGIDGLIAGLDNIDRPALEKADRLKVIARYGVGVDNVDLDGNPRKGDHCHQHPGSKLSFRGGAGTDPDPLLSATNTRSCRCRA